MTAKANHSAPAKPVVLFGLDSRGKPKGARFSKEYAGLAIKAASQLALQVLSGNHPNLADIAARLPVGRVHATGRTFVPFIGRDLYNQLLAAAGNGNVAQSPAPPASGAGGSAAGSRPPASSAVKLPRPRNWQEIGLGDLCCFKKVWKTAGTRPSSSKLTGTCSAYAGVIGRGHAGLHAIDCGWPCCIPAPNQT